MTEALLLISVGERGMKIQKYTMKEVNFLLYIVMHSASVYLQIPCFFTSFEIIRVFHQKEKKMNTNYVGKSSDMKVMTVV